MPGAMIARGVRQPPALRIDGKVVCRRRVPSAHEVRAYLEAASPSAAGGVASAAASADPPVTLR